MRLHDKRVLVLGGSSGIGLAVAEAALKERADVTIVSSRRSSVEGALARLGRAVHAIVADLREEADVADLFAKVGEFDHLVYTAGDAVQVGTLEQMEVATARGFLDLRFWGAVTAAKYGAPRLRAGGSITFTSSIVGQRPRAGWWLGACISSAMDGLTRGLAVDLAPLRVNAVAPGIVRSPLWHRLPEADREALFEAAGARLPVRRVGEPEDLASAYLFLMCQEFATGQTVVVDGGGVLV